MAGSMNVKKISKSQKAFKLSLLVLALSIIALVWVKCLTMAKSAELKLLNNKIEKKEAEIAEEEASEWYKKFLAVKSLESRTAGMYLYERIEKISEILEDLRNMNNDEEGWEPSSLILSDFYVSLEEISLRWIVSSLKELYYTSASWKIKSVLDRFESLDFIDKMVIKEYSNVGDWFEFTLFANVINNDWE